MLSSLGVPREFSKSRSSLDGCLPAPSKPSRDRWLTFESDFVVAFIGEVVVIGESPQGHTYSEFLKSPFPLVIRVGMKKAIFFCKHGNGCGGIGFFVFECEQEGFVLHRSAGGCHW